MNQNEEAMKSIRSLRGLDPFTVVFSGDSIAYNRYDFDPVPRTNGYDCFPGMLSWSFLLRDMFVNSSKGYVHGDILAAKHIVNRGEGSVRCGYKRSYVFPQYGRVLWYTAKSAKDKLTVGYNPASAEKIVLYMLSNPLKTSCRFDVRVNGEYALTVGNSGENRCHQGFEPFSVELKAVKNQENTISFENFVPDTHDQSVSEIFLVGISTETVYVHMTGQGSTTCKWLDDNCEERLLRYAPDLVYLSLAGNDIILSDPETFEKSLRSVIRRVRGIKPHCGFVLLPLPPVEHDSDYIEYDGWIYHKSPVTTSYYDKVNKVAEDMNACVVDTYALFSGMPVNLWRYDNIHFNQYGNMLLYKHLKGMLYPEGDK
jgi:hypothetical protein